MLHVCQEDGTEEEIAFPGYDVKLVRPQAAQPSLHSAMSVFTSGQQASVNHNHHHQQWQQQPNQGPWTDAAAAAAAQGEAEEEEVEEEEEEEGYEFVCPVAEVLAMEGEEEGLFSPPLTRHWLPASKVAWGRLRRRRDAERRRALMAPAQAQEGPPVRYKYTAFQLFER